MEATSAHDQVMMSLKSSLPWTRALDSYPQSASSLFHAWECQGNGPTKHCTEVWPRRRRQTGKLSWDAFMGASFATQWVKPFTLIVLSSPLGMEVSQHQLGALF